MDEERKPLLPSFVVTANEGEGDKTSVAIPYSVSTTSSRLPPSSEGYIVVLETEVDVVLPLPSSDEQPIITIEDDDEEEYNATQYKASTTVEEIKSEPEPVDPLPSTSSSATVTPSISLKPPDDDDKPEETEAVPEEPAKECQVNKSQEEDDDDDDVAIVGSAFYWNGIRFEVPVVHITQELRKRADLAFVKKEPDDFDQEYQNEDASTPMSGFLHDTDSNASSSFSSKAHSSRSTPGISAKGRESLSCEKCGKMYKFRKCFENHRRSCVGGIGRNILPPPPLPIVPNFIENAASSATPGASDGNASHSFDSDGVEPTVDFQHFLFPEVQLTYEEGDENDQANVPDSSLQSDNNPSSTFQEFSTPTYNHDKESRVLYPYDCYICSSVGVTRKFKDKQFFKRHLLRHQTTGKAILPLRVRAPPVICDVPMSSEYSCTTCHGRIFTDRKQYMLHCAQHRQIIKREGNDRPILILDRNNAPRQDEYKCPYDKCQQAPFKKRQLFFLHCRRHKRNLLNEDGTRVDGKDRILTQDPSRSNSFCPEQDEYKCTYDKCKSDPFTSRPSFLRHLLQHRRNIIAEDGKRIGSKRQKLRYEQYPIQDEYTCDVCEKKIKFRSSFLHHMRNHEKEKLAKEKQLEKEQKARPDIPIQDEYYCATCDRKFNKRMSYISHRTLHERWIREGVDRPIAEKVKKTEEDEEEEDEERDYFCETCDRHFDNVHSYSGHMSYHKKLQSLGKDRPIAVAAIAKQQAEQDKWREKIPEQDVYTCEICPSRTFTQRALFLAHVDYHRRIKKKEGEDRPVLTQQELALKYLQMREERYVCDKCEEAEGEEVIPRKFRTQKEFYRHMRLHHPGEQLDQSENGMSGDEFKNTMENRIPLEGPFTCETCPGRTFASRSSYLGHLVYHRHLKRQGADRVIMTKEQWAEKAKEEFLTGRIERKRAEYQCGECDKKFNKKRTYVRHLKYHKERSAGGLPPSKKRRTGANRCWKQTVPYQDSYTCEICPTREFPTRESYLTHVAYHRKLQRKGQDRSINSMNVLRQVLPDSEAFTCEEEDCEGKRFHTYLSYLLHQRHHERIKKTRKDSTEDNDETWEERKCITCDRTFNTRKDYQRHQEYHAYIRKKEGKDRAIKDRFGAESSYLYQKTYECNICVGKTFSRKRYLQHMRYHQKTGKFTPLKQKVEMEIPKIPLSFLCNCGQQFYFKDALEFHLKQKVTANCGEAENITPKEVDKQNDIQIEKEVTDADVKPRASEKDSESESESEEMIESLSTSMDMTQDDDDDYTEIDVTMESDDVGDDRDPLSHSQEKVGANCSTDSDPTPPILSPIDTTEESLNETKAVPICTVVPQATIVKHEISLDNVQQNDDDALINIPPSGPATPPPPPPPPASESDDDDDMEVSIYQCSECNADSDSLTDYIRHQFQEHSKEQQFPCPFCSLHFTVAPDLLAHCKAEHEEISEVASFIVICDLCKAEIVIEEGQEMEQHLKENHPELICRICSKMFYCKKSLNQHFLLDHATKKKKQQRSNPEHRRDRDGQEGPVITKVVGSAPAPPVP